MRIAEPRILAFTYCRLVLGCMCMPRWWITRNWFGINQPFLGEMQCIAFCLMLSSCVCMLHLWTPGKRFQIETSFLFKLYRMTPDITCKSLTQIRLQIPRWRTKWRPFKGMALSQAFIFHFKSYSLLHFAVCPLLCWAFLFNHLVGHRKSHQKTL